MLIIFNDFYELSKVCFCRSRLILNDFPNILPRHEHKINLNIKQIKSERKMPSVSHRLFLHCVPYFSNMFDRQLLSFRRFCMIYSLLRSQFFVRRIFGEIVSSNICQKFWFWIFLEDLFNLKFLMTFFVDLWGDLSW